MVLKVVLRAPFLEERFFQATEVINKENPVQVINLVLQGECEEVMGLNGIGSTVAVNRVHRYHLVSFNRVPEIWDAQASLFRINEASRVVRYLGIDEL